MDKYVPKDACLDSIHSSGNKQTCYDRGMINKTVASLECSNEPAEFLMRQI